MWRLIHSDGWMSFVLKEKLKGLKVRIKEWHKEVYGDMEAEIEKMVFDIHELDVIGEEVGLSGEEVLRRKGLFRDLWTILMAKDSNMVQRSRSRWLKNGDANSKYFHKCVKLRNNRNAIKALKVGDEWVQSPMEIRRTVMDYFSNHVAASVWEHPKLDGVHFERLRMLVWWPRSLLMKLTRCWRIVMEIKVRARMVLNLLLLKFFGIWPMKRSCEYTFIHM